MEDFVWTEKLKKDTKKTGQKMCCDTILTLNSSKWREIRWLFISFYIKDRTAVTQMDISIQLLLLLSILLLLPFCKMYHNFTNLKGLISKETEVCGTKTCFMSSAKLLDLTEWFYHQGQGGNFSTPGSGKQQIMHVFPNIVTSWMFKFKQKQACQTVMT